MGRDFLNCFPEKSLMVLLISLVRVPPGGASDMS